MGKKIGYIWGSIAYQNPEVQLDTLKNYGIEESDIYMEITGSKKERPKLGKMLAYLQPGDTLVIFTLDHIGYSLKNILQIADYLSKNAIHFVSINENINTCETAGRHMFDMLALLFRFEKDLITERINIGLKKARSCGKVGGRKPKESTAIASALKLYKGKEHSVPEITHLTGVSRSTLYRYLTKMGDVGAAPEAQRA
jgi:DNA invertase Pin-like site-specific DNA recombinase